MPEPEPTHRPLKALVTGGGGFLGGAVARQLRARGDDVTSFARGDYPALAAAGIRPVRGDIRDAAAVAAACQGMDIVFHVAAKPGVWGPYKDYHDINFKGTRHIVQACRRHQVPHLVYTSSPSVVFDGADMCGVDEAVPYPARFHSHYAATKALAEQHVIAAADGDLRAVALRPHLIWGPGDNHLVPRIIARARQLIRVGDGKNLVDTVYIDNAARAHLLAADRLQADPGLSGRTYFISQDAPLPLWEMIDRILAAGDYPPVTRSMSRRTAWVIGAVLETGYGLLWIAREPRMTRFVANELATAHWFDISAAKKDLGYVPAVSTEEGLARLARWLRETGRAANEGSKGSRGRGVA